MDDAQRNPYLILGIDYAATAQQARSAFARQVRRIRAMSDPPFTREDLAWALHEIEHPDEDPTRSVRFYRVPANRARFESPQPGELFFPIAEPLPRRTTPITTEDVARIADQAREGVVREILASARAEPCHDPYLPVERPAAGE